MKEFIYDDFLDLNGQCFHKHNLVVFYGESGSGKSTAIEYLLNNHPDFGDVEYFIMRPRISGWEMVPHHIGHVVIDEVFSLSDIPRIAKILRSSKKILVASHIMPVLFHVFFPHVRKKIFVTDKNISKFVNYLNQKNISFTYEALERYKKRYGATYTDMDIILEHTKESDFDRALIKFEKFCLMKLS